MILFENVTAGYEGHTIFQNMNLQFPDYPCIALMGPSGFGKTTLLRLLAGLMAPESGKITGNEGKISFLFQEDRLLPWETALKNVALCSDEQTAYHLLKQMEIEDVHQYPGEMSGGMQRRVAIARALAFGGELLLMDEPFKGLDEGLKKRVADVIKQHAPRIVMTTHDVQEAALMDANILHLDSLAE